ncbi:phytanoyl-CoA dioxygenase family protein [Mycolicibacterium sp. XJ1819]
MTASLQPTDVVREISDDEVAFYRENGWACLRNLISADLAAELLDQAKKVMGPDGQAHRPRPGIDPTLEWSSQYHYPAYEGIPHYVDVGMSAGIGRAAQRLMGRRVGVRYYRDMIACRPPESTRLAGSEATPPHQDYPSRIFDRVGYVNFWIALNEVGPERGSMQFLSGSHQEGPLGWDSKDRPKEEQLKLLEVYPEVEERHEWSEPLRLQPGDATCHGMLTVHRAGLNRTYEPRWSYITIYIPEDVRYVGNHAIANLRVGNPSHVTGDQVGVVPGGEFDHPHFPLVLPGE